MQRLAIWFGFQGVWLACAVGAANGKNWPGVAASLVYTASLVAAGPTPMPALLLAIASGFAGALIESGFVAARLILYPAQWQSSYLAPAWIVALWIAFGATVPTFAGMLGAHRFAVAAALGAAAGPLSYLAGERIGAFEIAQPRSVALLVLSLVWAVAMPLLVAVAARSARP